MNEWVATREDQVGGHVALAVVPYHPRWGISEAVRIQHNPRAMCLHCDDGGPRHFVAFGGRDGATAIVDQLLGPLLPRYLAGIAK